MHGKASEVGECGAPGAASLSEAPFCSGTQAALTPSGESMGKGDWAFSLPPPLLAGRDPRVRFALRGRVSALWFGKAAPVSSPHPRALRGLWEGFERLGKPRASGYVEYLWCSTWV